MWKDYTTVCIERNEKTELCRLKPKCSYYDVAIADSVFQKIDLALYLFGRESVPLSSERVNNELSTICKALLYKD